MYNYNPINVSNHQYEPDYLSVYQSGVNDYQKGSHEDSPRVLAWFIDIQKDFVYPSPIGRLSVPNAVEDTQRTIEWLNKNINSVSQIAASLDTHTTFQIFFSSWWLDKRTNTNPAPYTTITLKEVNEGIYVPLIDPSWSVYYLSELENSHKKTLMIWPPHCLEGSVGRALVPALHEAIMYHSGCRQTQPDYISKGTIAGSEYYSMVEPEVSVPKHPDGGKNIAFLKAIADFDLIYIAGQARSHCVLATVSSVMKHYSNRPEILKKLRFLNDCTSSIPGFETETENLIRDFVSKGMILVNSTDPIK